MHGKALKLIVVATFLIACHQEHDNTKLKEAENVLGEYFLIKAAGFNNDSTKSSLTSRLKRAAFSNSKQS